MIIDHIHFQYNGFLYGILVLSLVLARHQSTLVPSALLFAVLLCLKHIYLYLAPAYFVFLLRAYCLSPQSIFRVRFANCARLASALVAVFAAAFGPFVYWGQLEQLLRRLFPFSRGLCHAYWAPNVWAMYSFVDRLLIFGAWAAPPWPGADTAKWRPISVSRSTQMLSKASLVVWWETRRLPCCRTCPPAPPFCLPCFFNS